MNIQQIQKSKTKLIGKTIKYQEQITSTHTIAKQMATKGTKRYNHPSRPTNSRNRN